MVWRLLSMVSGIFKSAVGATAVTTVGTLGGYVVYKDQRRLPRMMETYSHGNILPPLSGSKREFPYFPRPDLENQMKNILNPNSFENEYFLVIGEVGTGKTRTILKVINEMIDENDKGNGAPIYVSASQGNNFPDSLARAVNFNYDEYLTFKFVMDYLMKTHSLPSKREESRLRRVLDAIEQSAFIYAKKYGRPLILVVDGIDSLQERMPRALTKLQDKSKLWADAGVARLVLISNDETTELILQENRSAWSRAGSPVQVEDLTDQQATDFLTAKATNGLPNYPGNNTTLTTVEADEVVQIIGGRLHHLVAFKKDWLAGSSTKRAISRLKMKEREKFLDLSGRPESMKLIEELWKCGPEGTTVTKLASLSLADNLMKLLKYNVVRIDRQGQKLLVKFESRLTEAVVHEMLAENNPE